MRLVVVGTGYVGLVCAAAFAETGHDVIGVDIDATKIDRLVRGEMPIFEPGLEDLARHALATGTLHFTTDLTEALVGADAVFCAVATPTDSANKADLRAVFAVAEAVAKAATADIVFVNKSTVPVGTGRACEERITAILHTRRTTIRIPVVSNPEFLQEGSAVKNALEPHRIVVGVNDGPGADIARERLARLYGSLVATGVPYVLINRESAEVTKYASNAFLATKISFINMMSELCEATGADVIDVATAMGQDPRIGPAFLQAGIGYGGSCFPKDVKALVGTAEQYRLNFALVSATQEINDYQRHRFFRTILAALPARSTVAVWGLSFKPGTDDVREAASLECIPLLLEAGHRICAYDPVAAKNAAAQLPATVTFATSAIDSATQADAVILLTDWPEFRDTDLHQLKAVMAGTLLFDGRNAFDAPTARAAGFVYRGIGR